MHSESGYFEYDSIDQIPQSLENIANYQGIYITLNPVKPALIARAQNRIAKAKRNTLTGETDIVCRRWLLVDIDPVRPAGISATDSEKTLALAKTCEIYSHLETNDFSAPIVLDSGNGIQLLYKIDLPADSNLPKAILNQLAKFSDEKVSIDQAVHNASRISRLAGTWNRKGDSTKDRPHRIATILDMPENILLTPINILERFANQNCSVETSELDFQCTGPAAEFNQRGEIEPVLEAYGWTLKQESDQQYWYRPGKQAGNHSATFDGDIFYNFSDNAEFFEARKGYNKFQVYAILEHAGDEYLALDMLSKLGFGNDYPGVDISKIVQKIEAGNANIPPPVNDKPSDLLEPESFLELRQNHQKLNPPIISGLLREGETMNIIASPKVGKSWLVSSLAICISSGKPWFDNIVSSGKVLHIDNELHKNTLAFRYEKVAEQMGVSNNLFENNLDILSLRGKLKNLYQLAKLFDQVEANQYKLIIIDAFYRTLPRGVDENSNGDIADLYNLLDRYAMKLNCGFVLIHHTSKGNQSGKSVTDIGAGAGSQSRAADSHLVIRPHECDDHFVVEAAVRSFPRMNPFILAWDWPVFRIAYDKDPAKLKNLKPAKKAVQVSLDEFVAQCIDGIDPCSKTRIRYEADLVFSLSERKADELIDLAIEEQIITKIKVGKRHQFVKIRSDKTGKTFTGNNAQLIAAYLYQNPEFDSNKLAEMTGKSRQYINQIKRKL